MEQRLYTIGDRVEQLCAVCCEERAHMVIAVSKRGLITRVSCSQCGTQGRFRVNKNSVEKRTPPGRSTPYDWTRTYRKGQAMLHPKFGEGEVMAVIEPKKIDVMFLDRVRRLIHSRSEP